MLQISTDYLRDLVKVVRLLLLVQFDHFIIITSTKTSYSKLSLSRSYTLGMCNEYKIGKCSIYVQDSYKLGGTDKLGTDIQTAKKSFRSSMKVKLRGVKIV